MEIGTLNLLGRLDPTDRRPLSEIYRSYVDFAVKCEQDGYDWFLVAEHHFMENQRNGTPLIILNSISQRTSAMRLGTNVLIAPMYHPVRLAEDAAAVDLLSDGRLDLVCGAGSVRGEFETLGIEADERAGRMWEVMEILRRSYSESNFDHKGKYYEYPNIRITSKPVQQPFPIWYGGAGPKNAHHAGREGYHILIHGGSSLEPYYEGLATSGLRPEDVNIGVCFVSIIVAATESEAEEARDRAADEGRKQAEEYARTRDLSGNGGRRQPRPLYNAGGSYIGTPEQVLRQMEGAYKNSLFTHIVPATNATNHDLWIKEVMPILKSWGRNPIAV